MADDRIITALDVHSLEDMKKLVETLGDSVSWPVKTHAARLPSEAPAVNALLLIYLYLFIIINVLTLQERSPRFTIPW